MKTRTKTIHVTIACAVVAFAMGGNTPLGQQIWPAKEMQTPPSDGQIPAFVAISMIEAVAFGLGVAFLLFAYPEVRKRTHSTRQALAAYLSIGWLLVSWFPHDNLHMFVGEQPGGLLALLWGFHATLIAAALVLAAVFVGATSRGDNAPSSAASRQAPDRAA